MQNKKNIFWST